MARRRKGREISGILVVDKPAGQSSNGVLQQVKRIYNAAKAGHTGALDPIATGVLPICLGEATKFSQRLLDSDKRYTTRIQLGESRTTADIEGELLQRSEIPKLTDATIQSVLDCFKGEITQVPPIYSALKHEGKKLYELAREGKSFDIQSKARTVSIKKLELLSFGQDYLELDVSCSKGTYIRSLGEDIAKALGTLGYVAVLRRLAAGPYQESMMITLDELQTLRDQNAFTEMDNRLLPTYTALESMPIIQVSFDQAQDLLHGRSITLHSTGLVSQAQVQLRLLHDGLDHLIGVGEIQAGSVVQPKRLLKVDGITPSN